MTAARPCVIKDAALYGALFSLTGQKSRYGVIYPQVGSWYRRLDGRLFEVVAVDDEELTVELQDFDGTIGEVDFDRWHGMELERAAAPEDYSGPLDLDRPELRELRGVAGLGWHDPMEFVDYLD